MHKFFLQISRKSQLKFKHQCNFTFQMVSYKFVWNPKCEYCGSKGSSAHTMLLFSTSSIACTEIISLLNYFFFRGISLTNFTGELPEELGNLSKLKYL